MPMKKELLLLTFAFILALQNINGQETSVDWNNRMPAHSISFSAGPSVSEPIIGTRYLPPDNLVRYSKTLSPIGLECGLDYTFSYLRRKKVSMGVGATYMFQFHTAVIQTVKTDNPLKSTRFGETFHYFAIQPINFKVCFGQRVVWDVLTHIGWIVSTPANTRIDGGRVNITNGNGMVWGATTGVNYLLTPRLGIGLNFNAIMGSMNLDTWFLSNIYGEVSARITTVYYF